MVRALKLTVGVALVVGIFVAVMGKFFVGVAVVSNNGMAPTVITGEKVLYWRGATPSFGDIGLCVVPHSQRLTIGRVYGTPDKELELSNMGVLLVGRVPIDLDYQDVVLFYDADRQRQREMRRGIAKVGGRMEHEFFQERDSRPRFRAAVTPPGSLYLLSDNRNADHQDSRRIGPVRADECIGTVFMRLEPVDDHDAGLGHGYLDIL